MNIERLGKIRYDKDLYQKDNVRAKTASYTYGTLSNKGVSTSYAVRPTFSLLSTVTYVSGDGTLNSPIRINW